ncbi:esterase [Purpureocillium lavendulum]|uniref:Esterase n=1 Tax=Purpureocillium lavendulum TaxID=1247861 RepID=A0AB34FM69_9HYPO|nr:esterase [Purpureocillium lavendulum]
MLQIDAFNTSLPADFALLSIGGNDLGFFDIMNSCIFRFYSFYSGTCDEALRHSDKALAGPEFEHGLRLVIMEILDRVKWEKNPWFTIFVTGYARFFNEDTEECDDSSFGVWWRGPKLKRDLRQKMNRMVLGVNDKIRRSVDAINAGFTKPRVMFVDYDDAFEGHRFCEHNITEPDYGRNNTWFFLVGGQDNSATNRSLSSAAASSHATKLSPSSPLVDHQNCLESAKKSGDWGELALCLMAMAAKEDPTLRTRQGEVVAKNSMWYRAAQHPPSMAPESEQTIKVASKKDSKSGTIKLKKPPPKHSKPGNWRDGSVVEDEKKKNGISPSTSAAASPGPVVNQLDDTARETFATGRPLEDSPDLQQCKHCKKSILKTAAKAHIEQCLKLKKEKAQRKKEAREARERAKEAAREEEARKADGDNAAAAAGDDDSDDEDKKPTTGGKKAAGKKPEEDKKGKKRKAENEPDKGPKAKKKKDEPKAKVPKPKGPVDVERQCGVILPNGQPCARSLTCKSHSMGAKRAVAGRSLPYDMLLAAYQKKNQAKQQSKSPVARTTTPILIEQLLTRVAEAALDANAPVEDDDDANNGPVDSDEETAAVMGALAHWNPQPLVPQPVFTPIKRQYQLSRLHEQLQMATNGGRTNIFQVVGFGAQRLSEGHPGALDNEDAPGEDVGNMPFPSSARSGSFGVNAAATQRRPSVTSRG